MNEKYVQINIGQGELTHEEWDGFQDATIIALRESVRGESDAPIEVHDGAGWWDEEVENSAHVSIVADVDTYALRTKLTELKATYNQDAITLIVGSDLI